MLKGWIVTIGIAIVLVALFASILSIPPYGNECGGFETVTSTLSNGSTTTMVLIEMAHPCGNPFPSFLAFIISIAGGVALIIYGTKFRR